jgi:hypothetical protein
MPVNLIAAVLLGPLAALYDFCTNPNAPPAIFVAQYTEAFGHAPGAYLPVVKPTPVRHKRVTVTRPA